MNQKQGPEYQRGPVFCKGGLQRGFTRLHWLNNHALAPLHWQALAAGGNPGCLAAKFIWALSQHRKCSPMHGHNLAAAKQFAGIGSLQAIHRENPANWQQGKLYVV